MSGSESKVAALLAACVRAEVRQVAAYHVPDATGLVKLDAMENPYTFPEPMRAALGARLREVALNRYPAPRPQALMAQLRAACGVPPASGLLLGNGSDEIIQMLLMALPRERAVLAPLPSFVMYEFSARMVGRRFVGVELGADFALDVAAMRAAIARERPGLIFIAYPNNPSGNCFDANAIEAILQAVADGLVVVDEAYFPFAQKSFLPRLNDYPNLLVMRTLSKQGLAGLRLGFLCGAPALIEAIDKIRLPYNINVLSQAAAAFALEQAEVLDAQAAQICAERALLAQRVSALGLKVWPSDANFLLFRVAAAARVFEALRANGVLIKKLDGAHPRLAGCLRVTVGTPAENTAFVAALERALG